MRNNGEDRENRPRKYGLTQDERDQLVERHFEQAKISASRGRPEPAQSG